MHNIKLFVAAGLPLDNPDIQIYRQSYIPAHSELTWILDCFTGFGEMNRMTQFKDKSSNLLSNSEPVPEYDSGTGSDKELHQMLVEQQSKRQNRISLGLLNYPVLMAADILLYGAKYVPVGEDQTQHLEFTRDIADRMNAKFSQELFVIPEPVKKQHEFFGKDQGLRIKDLQDPSKKMSKSDDLGKGVIFLGDSPEVAAKKIMCAETDSVGVINYDWENQPGITNLLQILDLLNPDNLLSVKQQWTGKTSYGDLKKVVAEAMKEFLSDFQIRLNEVNTGIINSKLNSSELLMNEQANKLLHKVQKAIGLR